MPTHDCLGSNDGRQLCQCLATEGLALGSQNPALIIREEDSLPAHFLHQYTDLRILELNDLLSLPVDPTCENQEQQLPRLEDESYWSDSTEGGPNHRM